MIEDRRIENNPLRSDCWKIKMHFSRMFVVIGITVIVAIFIIHIGIRSVNHIYRRFDKFDYIFARDSRRFVDGWKGTNRSLTVVTAFFDLGSFPKGSISETRNLDSYKSWMEIYKYIKNPLVIYTDSIKIAKFFASLQRNLIEVKIISRQELWSFEILPKIAAIYSKPDYPKYYPNTYVPEYASMTHSKLSVVVKAIEANYFMSDYYCWLDLGYFRELIGLKRDFFLEIPPDFDDSKVGVTRVYDSDLTNSSASSIILGNKNWIGGGLFLGKSSVLRLFESQYKQRVNYYLSNGLMNVEQHMLYAMYTEQERKKNPISVEVQLYKPGSKKVVAGDPWFYLGYLMYHEIPANKSH